MVAFAVVSATTKPHKIAREYIKQRFFAKSSDMQSIQKSLSVRYPVTEKKPIVVVIASYNNEKICEKNLQSVFDQTYDNYRVIYIDDCSKDQTYEKVKAFIQSKGQEHRVKLIHNETRQLKLPNLYHAYHSCKDHEIIFCLDGDDFLPHDRVLEQINQCYQNKDVWLTYGSAVIHPEYEIKTGQCLSEKTILKNQIRDSRQFTISMPRTFYAGLFKQIKLKDLFFNGLFYPSADDVAFMIPMIEMAGKHVLFLKDVLYIINDANPIREHKTSKNLGNTLRNHIFSQKKYQPLDITFNPRDTESRITQKPLELVVMSNDSPAILQNALESYIQYLSSLEAITVYYTASNQESKRMYDEIAYNFPQCFFMQDNEQNLKTLSLHLSDAKKDSSPYILVANDTLILNEPISLEECLEKLERTAARNLIVGHLSKKLTGIHLDNIFDALTISDVVTFPDILSNPTLTIMRKEDLAKTLLLSGKREKNLIQTHLLSNLNKDDICLFFANPKAISKNH